MKKYAKALRKAEDLRKRMIAELDPLQEALRDLLEDEMAHLAHQPGDNWVVCWGAGNNSAVDDLDEFLALDIGDAYAYLENRSI